MDALPPYAITNSALPLPKIRDRNHRRQGFEVPNTKKPGQTGHYRNALYPDLPTLDSNPGFPKTVYEIFNTGLGKSAHKPCLGHRPLDPSTGDFEPRYVWQTYLEVDKRRTDFGSGLVKLQRDGLLGEVDPKGWKVGIWTQNRPEWQVTVQAAAAYSLISLGLYDTLGPAVVEYCINHAQCSVVVASAAHLPAVFASAPRCPSLKVVVCADSWSDVDGPLRGRSASAVKGSMVLRKWAEQVGLKVFEFGEVEKLGAENPLPHIPPKADDIASFNYTSGTTGNPKAAILLHRTMTAAAIFNLHDQEVKEGELFISWLPCAHVYERFLEDVQLASGVPIGYACGDNLRLLEDLQLLKPTILAAVPRVLNRIYQAISAQLGAPGIKGSLARRGIASKLHYLKENKTFENALWDKLVFNKVRAVLGGRVRKIGSGSAPINPAVLDFMKVAFVCEVTEGYGATENAGTCTKIWEGDHEPNGTVGPPQAGVEIKLVDVPDMGYFTTDKPYPRGEVCVRGETCIPGYYKDEAKTRELIDADGWQHSGDVGIIDERGRLKIIDRIKSLLKLAQGEYVALEKIEGVYALCPLVAQIYLHGDSLEAHLIAVVVPDPTAFAGLVSKVLGRHVAADDAKALAEACGDRRVIEAALVEINKEAQKSKLNGFEMAKQLHLTLEPFSVENDLLTPTQKLKRPQAKSYFKEVTDKLYKEFKHPKARL